MRTFMTTVILSLALVTLSLASNTVDPELLEKFNKAKEKLQKFIDPNSLQKLYEEITESSTKPGLEKFRKDLVDLKDGKSTITEISLRGNDTITVHDLINLADVLKINNTLKKLDFEYCKVSDNGFLFVLEGLKVNTSVTDLNFSSNNITNKCAIPLLEMLVNNYSLTTIHKGLYEKWGKRTIDTIQLLLDRNKK